MADTIIQGFPMPPAQNTNLVGVVSIGYDINQSITTFNIPSSSYIYAFPSPSSNVTDVYPTIGFVVLGIGSKIFIPFINTYIKSGLFMMSATSVSTNIAGANWTIGNFTLFCFE